MSAALTYLHLVESIIGGVVDVDAVVQVRLDVLWWAMTPTEREVLEQTAVTHAPKGPPPKDQPSC